MNQLRNRDLDGLGQQWDEYKKTVGHADMNRGVGGMGMAERAEKIEALVRHVAELAPRRAQIEPIDFTRANADQLVKHLRESREAVMPRRRQHDPKFKYDIIRESFPHMAFASDFAEQWHGMHRGYERQHFPHLAHAGYYADKLVNLYLSLDQLEKDINRSTYSTPITPEQRNRLYDVTNKFSERMLQQWPDAIPDDMAKRYLPEDDLDRYNLMANRVHYHLLEIPGLSHPDRADSVGQIQKAITDMRYEVCAAAQRGFQEISYAYRADRKAMRDRPELQDARDPIRQQLPMLDRVYHARWALLADAIGSTVKSNRKLLEKYSGLTPQTNAEAVLERDEDRGLDKNGQGQLF